VHHAGLRQALPTDAGANEDDPQEIGAMPVNNAEPTNADPQDTGNLRGKQTNVESGQQMEPKQYEIASSITHQTASEYCAGAGKPGRLCWMVEVCPDGPLGPPLGGIKQGDHWAPVGDTETSWAAIGSLYAERRLCNDHVSLFGAPRWDQGAQDFKGTVFCCAGKPPFDVVFTPAPTEAPPELEVASPPPELNDGKDWKTVAERLQYWHEKDKLADLAEVHAAFKPDASKYISFETDFGTVYNVYNALLVTGARTWSRHAVREAFLNRDLP
jgi:hypothetical protein